jgi:hypothetical protein
MNVGRYLRGEDLHVGTSRITKPKELKMNERIKELAKEAKEYALSFAYAQAIGQPGYQEKFSEKFAELIVRECIDIAGKEDFDVMMKEGYPCSQTAKKIKEHFGVEE